jgi:3-carboxy-cis,cis-muconate cycloisomerase
MKTNLEATHGLIFAEAVSMALASKIGKAQAHEVVETACETAQREKRHLRDVIVGDARAQPLLSAADLDGLFDPRRYLGAAEEFVDRVVAASARSV